MNTTWLADLLARAAGISREWDLGVLGLIGATTLLSYWWGRRIWGRYERRNRIPRDWFMPGKLARFTMSWRLQLVAGVFYTSGLMALSALIMIIYPLVRPDRYASLRTVTSIAFEFPGVFFVFVTGVFSATTVINTICLLHRRIFEVRSFGDLSVVVDGFLDEGARAGRQSDGHETYFIDYVPVIGAFSEESSYHQIITKLRTWVTNERSVTHCIFLAPTEFSADAIKSDGILNGGERIGPMEKSIEDMVSKLDEDIASSKYQFMASATDDVYKKWDGDHCAIWFAERINFEHYMVGTESAVAYYITPDETVDETRNRISGTLQTDAVHVSYLREVGRTYISQAITPYPVTTRQGSLEGITGWDTELFFRVGQQLISELEICLYDEDKRPLRDLPQGKVVVQISGYLPAEGKTVFTTRQPSWVKIKLRKRQIAGSISEIESPESFFVKVSCE